MKRALIICLIVLLAVGAAAVGIGYGIGHVIKGKISSVNSTGANFTYSDSKSYKVGEASVSSKVSKITINWLNGMVKVVEHDGDTLSIKEEVISGSLTEELRLRWKKSGDEVTIQYAEANKRLNLDGLKKNLVVMVPSSWVLDELEIDVVSAASVISLNTINEISWHSVNGTLEVNVDNISEIEGETVNGDVDMYVKKSGPKKLDLESVNCNVTISVPSTSSFTLKRESINGSLDSDFAGKAKENKIFIVGAGDYDWRIESVNGNVYLREI